MDKVTTRVVVGIVLALVGLAPMTTTPARAAGTTGGLCHDPTRFRATPGLTSSPQQVTITVSGVVGPCEMSDSSIRSGTASGSGSGRFGCAGGIGSGVFSFAWNNGKTTTITLSFGGAGPLFFSAGEVTGGEFTGFRELGAGLVTVADPSACASPRGVTEGSFDGAVVFSAGRAGETSGLSARICQTSARGPTPPVECMVRRRQGS